MGLFPGLFWTLHLIFFVTSVTSAHVRLLPIGTVATFHRRGVGRVASELPEIFSSLFHASISFSLLISWWRLYTAPAGAVTCLCLYVLPSSCVNNANEFTGTIRSL